LESKAINKNERSKAFANNFPAKRRNPNTNGWVLHGKLRKTGQKNIQQKNVAGNQSNIAVKYCKKTISCNIKKKSLIPSFFFSLIWRLKLVI